MTVHLPICKLKIPINIQSNTIRTFHIHWNEVSPSSSLSGFACICINNIFDRSSLMFSVALHPMPSHVMPIAHSNYILISWQIFIFYVILISVYEQSIWSLINVRPLLISFCELLVIKYNSLGTVYCFTFGFADARVRVRWRVHWLRIHSFSGMS